MFKYLILLSMITVNAVQAQNVKSPSGSISGIVIYKARVTMRGKPTIDTLKFNRKKSFFQWERKMFKEITHVNNNLGPKKYVNLIPPPDSIGSYVIYNAAKDSMYMRKRTLSIAGIGSQGIFVKAPKPNIQWNITDSTKKIGKYVCTKATAHFRGRHYTAWFTPKIPVPYGPWKLAGLPRLILQAHDSLNKIRFKAKKVAFKNNITTGSPPLTGREKVLNLAEYKKWTISWGKRYARRMKAKVLRHQEVMAAKHGQSASGVTVSVPIPQQMEIFGKKNDKN
jgi:GLPGLI family protein